MSRTTGGFLLLFALLGLNAAPAQEPLRFAGEAGPTWLRARAEIGGATEITSGPGVELRASVSRGWLVAVRYAQARLGGDEPIADRDATDAEALVGYAPAPWLSLATGPHVRGYSTDASTRRVFAWEVRARVHVPLLAPHAAVYAEAWHSLAGSTNQADDFDFLRGGEVGFQVQVGPTPLHARLAYRIDRARGAGPVYDDTAERFVLAAGIRLP